MTALTRDPFCITLAYSIYDANSIEAYLSDDSTRPLVESCMPVALSQTFNTRVSKPEDIIHWLTALYSPEGKNFIIAAKYGLLPLITEYLNTLPGSALFSNKDAALRQAIANHQVDTVRYIMDKRPDFFDDALLSTAIRYDDPDILKVFRAWYQCSAWILESLAREAANYDSINSLKYIFSLLDQGDIHLVAGLYDKLYYAAVSSGAAKIIAYLLQFPGSEYRLDSGLVNAAKYGKADVIRELVAARADISGKAGSNALRMSQSEGHRDISQLLRSLGASAQW